jgi:hypothetical protein
VSPTTAIIPTSYYSADEENWLQGKLRIFEECWNRVPVSDDLVSEFVMFTYDVPLSRNFVPDHLAVFNERYLLMMKVHSEFTNMNRFEQEKLWKKNILYGSAMNLVKLECCKGGKEQWHFVYPTYLNETWKGKNILSQKNIKKIDMDIANSFSGVFSDTELARFGKLTQYIGELIHDDETFRLFTLVLLFSDVDNQPNLTRLRDSYLSIIRRRLSHLQDFNFQNYDDWAIGSLVYSKFSSCVAAIKELSFFVQKLLDRLKTA